MMTESKRERYIRILSGITDMDAGATLTANATAEVVELLKEPVMDAVSVKHGRWLWRNYPGYQYQCDQCKRWAMFESKFCPNCGALMKWWEDGDGNG